MFASQPAPGGRGVSFEPESLTPAQRFAERTLTHKPAPRLSEYGNNYDAPAYGSKRRLLRSLCVDWHTTPNGSESRTRSWISWLPQKPSICRTSDQRLSWTSVWHCGPHYRMAKIEYVAARSVRLNESAYTVRSSIVHGDSPKPKDLKVQDVQVRLPEFVEAIERVVRQALHEALDRATSQESNWPPDWDGLTLPK